MIRNWVYTDTTGLRISRFWQTVAVLALLSVGYSGSNLVNPSGVIPQVEEPSRVVVQAGEAGKTALKSNQDRSPALNLAAVSYLAEVEIEPTTTNMQAAPRVAVVTGNLNYLPDGARARLGRGTLRDAVLSENAEYLYVAGSIGVFAHRVGDFSETWKVITDEPVDGLNVSPDGNFLAYFINNQVRILDTKTGEHISTFEAGEIEIRAVVFDPESAHLAVQSDYTVSLWSLARAELVNKYVHESGISAIAWSGEGDRLAVGDSLVLVWDPWGEAAEASETGMEGTITGLVWSQEAGLVVAGLVSGGLEIWKIDSGEMLVTESGHDLWVSSLDVSPESNLVASGGKDGRIVFWDGRTGQIKKSIPAHQGRVARVAFLLDGSQLLSAGLDGRIAIWDVGSGEGIQIYDGYTDAMNEVAWSPDGNWIAGGGMDGSITIWQAATGIIFQKLEGHQEAIERLVWSNNSAMLASLSSETAALVWDVEQGEILLKIEQRIKVPEGAVLMPDGSPLESEMEAKAYDVSFSPDDRFLALGGKDTRVYIWDLESGERENALDGHTWEIIGVDFINGGERLVSMSMDGRLLYWDLEDTEPVDQKYFPGMTSMVLSPDEEFIAMGEWDGHVVMWDTTNEIPCRSFNGSNDVVFPSEFSPDGDYLITGEDGELRSALLWDQNTGEILESFTGHNFDIRGVSISPDGAVLATAAWDGTILLWDLD